MSTQVSTSTDTKPEVIVTADASVIKAIASYLTLSAKAEAAVMAAEVSGYIGIARSAIPVVARQGYTDKAQVKQLLDLSFLSQAGVLELADNDPKKVEVLERRKSDVSNLTAIIAPKSKDLADARDKAFKYNDSLPKDCRPNLRIGQKHILAIVRGNTSVDDVIAIKEGREPAKPTPANGGTSAAAAGVNATASPTPTGTTANAEAGVTSQNGVPQPEPGSGVTVSNPADAFRHLFRTMLNNYQNNMGVDKDTLATVAKEELNTFLAAK